MTVVWKNINQHEYTWLQWCYGDDASKPAFQCAFLAAGVFMLDGQNLLQDRERCVRDLARLFAEMPPLARKQVIKGLAEINRRAGTATRLIEAYAMEASSRYRWAQLKGLDLAATSVTGVQGTDQLGLNWAQLLWRCLNYYEDVGEEAERGWDLAKFTGSCFTKLTRIYQQEARRKRQRRIERIERKDLILRQVLLLEPESLSRTKSGQQYIVAHDERDLLVQMAQELRGEKDLHDRVVEETLARIQRQSREQQESLAALQRANALDTTAPVQVQTDMTGYTLAQIQEMNAQERQQAAQTSPLVDARFLDEATVRRMQRWGIVEQAPEKPGPTPPDRSQVPVVPFRRR